MDDTQSIPGLEYGDVQRKYLDSDLVAKNDEPGKRIADMSRQIENQAEKQRVVGDSSRNLQQTINQLIELQKIGI